MGVSFLHQSWFCSFCLLEDDGEWVAFASSSSQTYSQNQAKRKSKGKQHCADHQVDAWKLGEQTCLARIERVGVVHGDVEEAHPFEVDFEDGDVGADPGGDAGGVDPGGAPIDDHDLAWEDTGHAPE